MIQERGVKNVNFTGTQISFNFIGWSHIFQPIILIGRTGYFHLSDFNLVTYYILMSIYLSMDHIYLLYLFIFLSMYLSLSLAIYLCIDHVCFAVLIITGINTPIKTSKQTVIYKYSDKNSFKFLKATL